MGGQHRPVVGEPSDQSARCCWSPPLPTGTLTPGQTDANAGTDARHGHIHYRPDRCGEGDRGRNLRAMAACGVPTRPDLACRRVPARRQSHPAPRPRRPRTQRRAGQRRRGPSKRRPPALLGLASLVRSLPNSPAMRSPRSAKPSFEHDAAAESGSAQCGCSAGCSGRACAGPRQCLTEALSLYATS